MKCQTLFPGKKIKKNIWLSAELAERVVKVPSCPKFLDTIKPYCVYPEISANSFDHQVICVTGLC